MWPFWTAYNLKATIKYGENYPDGCANYDKVKLSY
jgi:hypothetical protein